jgi:hypothetical protein
MLKAIPCFLTILFCMSTVGCNEQPAGSGNDRYPLIIEGVIQKTGVTTYMYGSHTISDNGETFALQSTRINLDRYINKRVIVKGSQVEGYPVDDGPKLIDVKEVQQK